MRVAIKSRRKPKAAPVRVAAETMRAVACDSFGPPSVLSIHRLPVPGPGPNEVLIAVHTAGVARWDAEMRKGWVPPGGRPRFPLVLGTDGSGTIAALGSRTRRFQVGDRVYAVAFMNPYGKGGFFAEYVAVEARTTARLPRGLDLERAGAIPITGLTALQGVDDALRLRAGETVIIHGACGGVGTLAVQFAKLRGAKVLATASGSDGVALVRRLGADAAVEGHEDLTEAALDFAGGPVDAVLAFVGGTTLTRCIDALKRGGRLAYPHGVEPAPRKRRGVRAIAYDGLPGVRELERLGRAIEDAKLEVPIADSFTLDQAKKSQERLEGHVLGKVVLRVR
jgi:NADPH:quinone reductase-like Zn-dependent oxidoreductase